MLVKQFNIIGHCGDFATLEEAIQHQTMLLRQLSDEHTVEIRKRTTSIQKDLFPYEVVIVYNWRETPSALSVRS